MRLMPEDRADNEGRFASEGDDAQLPGSGYGGIVLDRLARHTCRIAGVAWSCLLVRDRRDPRQVIVAAGHGLDWETIGARFAADEGAIGHALLAGEPVLVGDHTELAPPFLSDEARPGAAVPILVAGVPAGALCAAMTGSSRSFDDHDIELLAELAELAAAALEHGHLRERQVSATEAHVQALAVAMDLRDHRTAKHSEDVVGLARKVGELLELEQASLIELEFAARLHDVGKIRVPDAVLNKPGPLDDEEFDTIRCHAAWGAETLSQIPGLEAVATVVRFHHERWDGQGYPDGLEGPRIPLASRIISVCDAYGAMTCDRPYRGALDPEEALDEIRAASGRQFDPAVVDALLEAVAESGAPDCRT